MKKKVFELDFHGRKLVVEHGELEKQASGVLYKAYQIWAKENGEFPKRNSDFSQALNMAGFPTKRTNKCVEASGLSLDPETLKKQNPFL